jgi:hypothetical protein
MPWPVMARAAQSIAAWTRSSSRRPKPIRARSRLPFRQWITADGGGGRSALAAEQPNPPEVVGHQRST